MKYLRMVWRFMTLDDRPMDENWRPITMTAGLMQRGEIIGYFPEGYAPIEGDKE